MRVSEAGNPGRMAVANASARGPAPVHPLNPCELEIDLFCQGLRLDEGCGLGDCRPVSRTRAGLGSGLELVIPGSLKDVWVNAPIEEHFAAASSYRLLRAGAECFLLDERNGFRYRVVLPAEPAWYSRRTTAGTLMSQVGVLQGTYLAIYISNACGFWYHQPRLNCRFCTTGLNVGVNEIAHKSVDDVVEVALAAKAESGVNFVHLNSGFQSGHDLERAAAYVKALKSRVGVLVGLQLSPTPRLWQYDWLMELGTDHFSFCYEFHNPEYFRSLLPGKEMLIGREAFFKALEYASAKMGKGRCSGEIIAGIEPIPDTLSAIDYITSLGAFPTVCVFRPTIGSDMEHWSPPKFEDMLAVFRHVYDACRRHLIPVDVTPNIEVSLVVQPGDTLYLAPRTLGSFAYRTALALARWMARPYFAYRARRRRIETPIVADEYKRRRPADASVRR
jgi:hypothetical protein